MIIASTAVVEAATLLNTNVSADFAGGGADRRTRPGGLTDGDPGHGTPGSMQRPHRQPIWEVALGWSAVKLVMSHEEAVLHSVIGTDALLRPEPTSNGTNLTGVRWAASAGLAYGRVRGASGVMVSAKLVWSTAGRLTEYQGACTCGTQQCAHSVALALMVMAEQARAAAPTLPRPRKRTPAWEAAVARLVDTAAEVRSESATEAELALQFDIRPAVDPGRRSRTSIPRPLIPVIGPLRRRSAMHGCRPCRTRSHTRQTPQAFAKTDIGGRSMCITGCRRIRI